MRHIAYSFEFYSYFVCLAAGNLTDGPEKLLKILAVSDLSVNLSASLKMSGI